MTFLEKLGLHRKELRAWAMFDWANSAFATTIMAAMLPIYYTDVAAKHLDEGMRTASWGYITAFALLMMAVASPILGALADYRGSQKKYLFWLSLVGAAGTSALWFVGEGDWMLAAALYLIGNVGFYGSAIFYDALLPHVAKPEEIDRASTAGYALGYIGGGLLLALNLAWVMKPELFGFAGKGVAVRLSFVSVGIWWAGFTWFALPRVPEPPAYRQAHETGSGITVAFKRLGKTFREIRSYKQILIFLVGYWFYTDGVGTIIKMATIFGREVGIGTDHLIGALLLVQFLGIPCTFAFGALASKIGAKAGLMITLVVYTGICILGYFMTEAWHFWALAVLVATVQGGCQALSRSLYAQLVPKSKTAEFFGFVSVSGRFAGIAGPALFGLGAQLTGGSRISILSLVLFFVIGMIALMKLDLEAGKREADAAEAALSKARAV